MTVFGYFRLNVELACDMQFEYYPMDTQICEVQLQSCEYILLFYCLNSGSKLNWLLETGLTMESDNTLLHLFDWKQVKT